MRPVDRHVSFIYQLDEVLASDLDYELESNRRTFEPGALAHEVTFDFIRADDLVPIVRERPALMNGDTDLLANPRCFAVSRVTWNAAADSFLKAIYETIAASDSLLLNHSLSGSDALEHDKLAICAFARSLGIPTIDTYVVPYGKYACRVLEQLPANTQWLLKPRDMGMGIAILKVEQGHQLRSALDLTAQSANGYVLQPFVKHEGDLRVYIINSKVEATLLRTSSDGGYISNLSRGSKPEWNVELSADIETMSLRIARALQASYVCIDWLLTDSGPLLNEWCTVMAGIRGNSKLGHAFFAWVVRRTQERNAMASTTQ